MREILPAKPTDKALLGRVSEYAGRNKMKPDKASSIKFRMPSRHNYGEGSWRTRTRSAGTPSGGVEGAARVQGHRLKQGRAPRPAEKTRGSKVVARAERQSAAKARAWRMGPYERRSGVTPAERRGPAGGIRSKKRGRVG